jgi:hypothetical protein
MKLSAFALFLGLALTGPAQAAEPVTAAEPAVTAESVQAPQASGLVVTWDKEKQAFGQPSAEQRSRIIEEMNRLLTARFADNKALALDAQTAAVEVMPNGTRRARLPLSLMNMSVVRVAQDGSFVPACTPTLERAAEALHTPVTNGPNVEEK